MAFGSFRDGAARRAQPLAEINMIPLIDVMLVLLVIFIVTAPLLTHAVKIDLPKVSSTPNDARPRIVQIAIRADGSRYWDGEAVDSATLLLRLGEAGRGEPAPEVHLRADRSAEYALVADLLAMVSRAGLTRIAFVSEPR